MLYLLYLHILPYIITIKTEFLDNISICYLHLKCSQNYILIISSKRKSVLILMLLIEIIKKSTSIQQFKIKIYY